MRQGNPKKSILKPELTLGSMQILLKEKIDFLFSFKPLPRQTGSACSGQASDVVLRKLQRNLQSWNERLPKRYLHKKKTLDQKNFETLEQLI